MNNDCLKFRAFDKKTGDYIKPSRASLSGDGKLLIYSRDYEDWNEDDDDYIIERCTGLRDKNGTLIYEGDVLLAYDPWDDGEEKIKFSVKWEPENALFFLRKVDSYWEATFERVKDIEIIGNIHEGDSK